MPESVRPEDQAPAVTRAAPQPRKGPRGKVIIFATWCKGCQICVEFCPAGVLAFDPQKERAVVAAPGKCTACHFCDTHCPDLAIVVKRLD
jgi:2-oxoglutarate ferredoxin oxidoreductase subunit delta